MARPKKYTEEQLERIFDNYVADTKYITQITYRDLVTYANKIGYKDIIYQDFFRNNRIKSLVENMNNQKVRSRVDIIENGEIKHYKLNVEELVEKTLNDKIYLKKLLHIFKEGYDKAFNELKKNQIELVSKEVKIKELESVIRTLNNKNIDLKLENRTLKEKNKIIRKNKKNQAVLEGLKYVISECNVKVSNEGEVSQLLTNFGVDFNKNTTNLAEDLKDTLESLELEIEDICDEVNNDIEIKKSDNIISLNDKKNNGKFQVKKPDYLV